MPAPEASLAGPPTGRNNGNTPGRFFCFLRRLSIGAYYNIVFLALHFPFMSSCNVTIYYFCFWFRCTRGQTRTTVYCENLALKRRNPVAIDHSIRSL
jgi:hypothetical protein